MCNRKISLLSVLVLLSMLVGMIWVMPMATSAETAEEISTSTVDTTPDLPAGITPWNGSIATSFAGGSGTADDPYLISDAAEFEFFRNQLGGSTKMTAYYLITKDIVFNTDINVSDMHHNMFGIWNESVSFGGVLDGGGHTIYNMYSNGAGNVPALFHHVGEGAVIKNLNFDGVRFVSAKGVASGGAASVIAHSDMNGTVENVHARNVILEGYNAGGFVGRTLLQHGSVKNCSVENATIKGYTAGGIVNSATGGAVIENCTVSGAVSGSYFVGGISGYNTDDTVGTLRIKNCTNHAEITATTSGAGILGAAQDANGNTNCNFLISDCVNNGKVTTQKYAGGMVGTSYTTQGQIKMYRCVNNGDIMAETNAEAMAGGMFARISSGGEGTTIITDCVNFGKITSDASAGGLFGQYTTRSGLRFTSCANFGNVIGKTDVGGFVGCYTTGTAMFVHNSVVCGTIGDLSVANHAGSFAGSITTTDVGVTINNSLVMANVSGKSIAGGIAGYVGGNGKQKVLTLNNVWVHATMTSHTQPVTYGQGFSLAGTTNYGNFAITLLKDDASQAVSGSANKVDAGVFVDGTVQGSLNDYVTNKNSNLGDLDPHIPWVQNKNNTPTLLTTIGFSGATMTLGENMMLNLKLNPEVLDGTGVTSVTFVRNGEATPGNATVDANGYYTAAFACDAADFAKSAAYHMVFTAGGNDFVGTNVLTYAPIEYATALYKDEEHPETQDLIEKMLSMASLSEKAKYGAGSNAIATAASNAGFTLPTEYTIPENMKYYALNKTDAAAAIDIIDDYAMTGADLNGSVNLVLKVTDASITEVVVTSGVYNETFEVKDSYVTITGLGAKHIANLITIAFHDANGLVASTDFSVGNYLQAVITNAGDDTATKNLATAMILYMMSVKAYAGA